MAEYLSEEEQMNRIRSWWADNGRLLMIGAVVIAALLLGWKLLRDQAIQTSEASTAALDQYLAADEEAQVQQAQAIATEFAGTTAHALVAMHQAGLSAKNGDLQNAEDLLQSAVDAADGSLLEDLAQIRLAKIQVGLDNGDEALATLNKVRREGYRAWAMEVKGDIHLAQDEVELAHLAYQAAMQSLQSEDRRPLLEIKVATTAAYEGEYVPFVKPLEEALRRAQDTLATSSDIDMPADNEAEVPAEGDGTSDE